MLAIWQFHKLLGCEKCKFKVTSKALGEANGTGASTV